MMWKTKQVHVKSQMFAVVAGYIFIVNGFNFIEIWFFFKLLPKPIFELAGRLAVEGGHWAGQSSGLNVV